MLGSGARKFPLRQRFRSFSSSAFDNETAVVTTSSSGIYNGTVSDKWSISGAPNGGMLAATALSAMRSEEPDFRDPLTFTCHYINKAEENADSQVKVECLGRSRSSATLRADLRQGTTESSTYLAVMGDLSKLRGPSYFDKNLLRAPILPPPVSSHSLDVTKMLRSIPTFTVANRFEMFVSRDSAAVQKGMFKAASGDKDSNSPGSTDAKLNDDCEALLECWMRFSDERHPCLRSMLFFLDAAPPPVLNLVKVCSSKQRTNLLSCYTYHWPCAVFSPFFRSGPYHSHPM
jgi:hypothetical protein